MNSTASRRRSSTVLPATTETTASGTLRPRRPATQSASTRRGTSAGRGLDDRMAETLRDRVAVAGRSTPGYEQPPTAKITRRAVTVSSGSRTAIAAASGRSDRSIASTGAEQRSSRTRALEALHQCFEHLRGLVRDREDLAVGLDLGRRRRLPRTCGWSRRRRTGARPVRGTRH